MKIKEIIVVEGKSDTISINRAVQADTIETNGSAINKRTLNSIKLAQEKRGVIVFTDPDYQGERIRKIISQHVPGCKHAFLTKAEAFKDKKSSLGIEHAKPETIRRALEKVYSEATETPEIISFDELLALGLIGGPGAKGRRERLCDELSIGYTNGKQLYKRLRIFQITQEEFSEAIQCILQEDLT